MNAIFITARLGSTRLPFKHLKKVLGHNILEYLIRNLKKSKLCDKIILCTTEKEEDGLLCHLADRNKIEYFRGSVEDKLDRWNNAAKFYGITNIVTADGDDIFCEPELIDLAFKQLTTRSRDFIWSEGLVCGAFTYAFTAKCLDKICSIKGTNDTEMIFPYFNQPNLFKIGQLENVPEIYKRPEIRATLDYEEDLLFFKTIIEHFRGGDFSLVDVIKYIDEKPEIVEINKFRHQEFLDNQKKKTKLVLKS